MTPAHSPRPKSSSGRRVGRDADVARTRGNLFDLSDGLTKSELSTASGTLSSLKKQAVAGDITAEARLEQDVDASASYSLIGAKDWLSDSL